MADKVTAEKIMLGYGVVTVGLIPVGLTRGGSSFVIERKFRNIEADGDYGPVKGRVILDGETAKLEVNALELFNSEDLIKYYPAMTVTLGKLTSTLEVVEGDYNDVKWVGKTKDGKAVTINVENALNLDNLEWKLEDKNEVIPKIGFAAHYDEATRTTAPWNVEFAV